MSPIQSRLAATASQTVTSIWQSREFGGRPKFFGVFSHYTFPYNMVLTYIGV